MTPGISAFGHGFSNIGKTIALCRAPSTAEAAILRPLEELTQGTARANVGRGRTDICISNRPR